MNTNKHKISSLFAKIRRTQKLSPLDDKKTCSGCSGRTTKAQASHELETTGSSVSLSIVKPVLYCHGQRGFQQKKNKNPAPKSIPLNSTEICSCPHGNVFYCGQMKQRLN